MILDYFRRRRSLLAELAALRASNAQLRDEVETARIQQWIRRHPEPPRRRPDPHPIHPGRQQLDQPTEVHARRTR